MTTLEFLLNIKLLSGEVQLESLQIQAFKIFRLSDPALKWFKIHWGLKSILIDGGIITILKESYGCHLQIGVMIIRGMVITTINNIIGNIITEIINITTIVIGLDWGFLLRSLWTSVDVIDMLLSLLLLFRCSLLSDKVQNF